MIVKDSREKRIVKFSEILIGETFARYHEGLGYGYDDEIFIKSDKTLAIKYSKCRKECDGIADFKHVSRPEDKYQVLLTTLTIH